MIDYGSIQQPFVLSFSGGRTSAFLLHQILSAFGGIPDGCHVVFANTGKEHPATLDFVRDISEKWGVDITWVERLYSEQPPFKVVTYETASRDGYPFSSLIQKKKFLPNSVMRFCTEELKVKAIAYYLRDKGVVDATMVLGLRADEPRRVHKVQGDERNGLTYDCPMYRNGHTLDHVMEFWSKQPFDLMLPNNDRAFGNCDLCFLKGRVVLDRVMRHDPSLAQWWIDKENEVGAKFNKDRPTYANMLVQVRIQPQLFSEGEDETISCTCTD